MKYRLFIIPLLLALFAACSDDDEIGFDAPVEFRKPLEFKAMPGGAIMKYYLPDNADIFGIRVRYTNGWGEEQIRDGSYLSDSLVLGGFTEAQKNVPAQLTFFNRNMEESEPMDVTFDTKKSATMAVFDELKVNSFWGGFNITYSAPESVSGMLHIFYVGTNPLTHETDSILMSSLPIIEGGDTLNFVLQQTLDSVDVVVRADENSGYRVNQRVTKVPCLTMDTLKPADFDFKFTGEWVEDEEHDISLKYLFDGDKKGAGMRAHLLDGFKYTTAKYSTCLFGPQAFHNEKEGQDRRFIIDLREEKVPASVNLYAYIYFGDKNYPTSNFSTYLFKLWGGYYRSRLPNEIYLYGTNENPETVDLATCTRLYALDYPEDVNYFAASWAKNTDDRGDNWESNDNSKATDKEFEAAESTALKMRCSYSGEKFRYLIFVVKDTFNSRRWLTDDPRGYEENPLEYITINELEVCVKAE